MAHGRLCMMKMEDLTGRFVCHDARSNLKVAEYFKIKPNGALLLGVQCIWNNFETIGSFYAEYVMVLRCFVYHDASV